VSNSVLSPAIESTARQQACRTASAAYGSFSSLQIQLKTHQLARSTWAFRQLFLPLPALTRTATAAHRRTSCDRIRPHASAFIGINGTRHDTRCAAHLR